MLEQGRTISGSPMRGITLIESMMMLVILSVVSLGASVGLQSIAKVPGQTDDVLAINTAVIDRMERMRAEPWATMSTKATALTNTNPGLLINNKRYACTVSVADTDADGSGVVDTDFRTITVTIGTQTMSVYETQP